MKIKNHRNKNAGRFASYIFGLSLFSFKKLGLKFYEKDNL